jgi:hypothetical protein
MGKTFKLGENVDINFCKVHDKIRFSDYFDSLLEDKDVRGHNFEGFVCGLFDGKLAARGAKYDLTIEGKRYSVKFVDYKGKAPEVGRFKNIITQRTSLDEMVIENGGLTRIFKGKNTRLKSGIWNVITAEIDGWILAYPDDINNPKNIVLNTSGIADYIGNKYPKLFDYAKSEIVLHCKKYQKHVWSKILKLEKRSIFNNKDYVFYNQMTTDGFSCCLLFILKKYKDKEYGDKLPKCIQDDCDIKNVNSLTKDECNKYLTDE